MSVSVGMAWLACALAAPPLLEPAPPLPLVFAAGPRWDMESGVRTSESLLRMGFGYDEALSARFALDETEPVGKLIGMVGRGAKILLVDYPLVDLQDTLAHEVFGHGARAREFGLRPYYVFRLPPPYRGWLQDEDGPSGVTIEAHVGLPDPDRIIVAGGSEANYAQAYWIELGAVRRDGWMRYDDLLAYGVHRLIGRAAYGAALRDADRGGGDTARYVAGLQFDGISRTPPRREDLVRSLNRAYILGYIDPTFWLAAFHGVWSYGVQGRKQVRLPMLRLGEVALYPGTRFGLSPFGAEHTLDLFARWRAATFDVSGRVGSSGLAPYWGVGARALDLSLGAGLSLGGELDVWRQPELFLDGLPAVREQRTGAHAALHAGWTLYRHLGVVGKLGAKTQGYVAGLPVGGGPYGYLGLSLGSGHSGALIPASGAP